MKSRLQAGFRVGEWEVRPQQNLLEGPSGARVLEPKVMDVLVFLAERQGEVVSRRELLDSVWADVVVGDETLSRAVSVLRTELAALARLIPSSLSSAAAPERRDPGDGIERRRHRR